MTSSRSISSASSNLEEESALIIKKQWFIQSRTGSPKSQYILHEKVGKGAFGDVYRAQLKSTRVFRVIKMIKKKRVTDKIRLLNEVNIMRELDSPHFVKLHETYEDEQYLYLVQEYCTGGDLYDKVVKSATFTEEEVKPIFRDIVKAIVYCHSKNICHRDLKPENFLFMSNLSTSTVKLTDFGLSRHIRNKQQRMSSFLGTAYYIAPEVIQGNYSIACDVWSLGVILIVLLTGQAPYNASTDQQIYEKIKNKQLNTDLLSKLTLAARSLILQCLKPEAQRISAQEILNHTWMTEIGKKPAVLTSLSLHRLKEYQRFPVLKKIALNIMASQAKSKEIEDISRIFRKIDANGDGVLSYSQLSQAFPKKEFSKVQKIFNSMDGNHDGEISFGQFVSALIDPAIYLDPIQMREAFRILDTDGNGQIQIHELRKLLQNDENKTCNPKIWARLIKQADSNGDGKISFSEFVNMLCK